MKILEMTATFGTLHKATLRPGPGLTLIMAPNESGKSTWAAFLRAMLYGFPQRDRNREGYLAEKNRYQPWSGAAMEGTLVLEWQGRSLTLYRGPKGTTAWGSFSAVWTATGEAVDGLTADSCGETLLGVSREVFERTAFVAQGEVALSPSGDLEKRVAALATSGEEEVSCSQVERRLKDWLNRRKVNSRVGLIPELEGELAQVEEALSHQGSLLRQAQEARQEKEALEAKKTALETQLRSHAAQAQALQGEKREQAQREYETALADLRAAEKTAQALPPAEELRQRQGDLSYLNTLAVNLKMAEKAVPEAREKVEAAERAARTDALFGNLDAAQAAQRAQRDYDEVERLQKKSSLPLFLFLGALLGAIPGALLALACPGPLVQLGFSLGLINGCVVSPASMLWIIPPCILLGAAIAGGVAAAGNSGRRKRAFALLSRYNAQSPEDILNKAAAYQEKWNAAQEAKRELQAVETDCAKLSAQKEELTGQLLSFVHPFAGEVTDLFGVSAALSRALQQGERYTLAKARAEHAEKLLSALPSPTGEASPLLAAPQGEAGQLAAQLETVNAELRRFSDAAARLQGELRSLGDPAELEARRSRLLEELELRQGEYEAIAAAMESLKNADSLLRERFSPAVNERAGHYLSLLTGGRYDKAHLSRQFQALAQEAGEAAPRQDLSLSGGAVQQLYLAVRLAMCELALPQQEPCPILLDDALDAFDDERAGLALDCLQELARTRQVLLFTCHSREKALLEGTGAEVIEEI